MINTRLMLRPGDNAFRKKQEKISKPDKILIDPLLDKIKYSQKLDELMTELGINNVDLAAATGMDRDTIAKYRNGYNAKPIKPDKHAKINHALNEAMFYKGYEHMPTDQFGELLAELWKEFKDEINQTDIAVMVGHGNQGEVSQKISGDIPVKKTAEQYDYLIAFYDLCKRKAHYWFSNRPSKLEFYSRHYETVVKLEKLLFGYSAVRNNFSDNENNGEKLSVAVINEIIDQLITLPIEAQKLILSYPFAFLDSLSVPNFHNSDGSYISAGEFIERFRQLPKDERLRFYNDMQKLNADEKIYNYSYGESDWFLFDMNLQYYNMINSAKQRKIADPVIPAFYHNNASDPIHDNSVDSFRTKQDIQREKNKEKKEKRFEEQRHSFERVINSFDDRCWKNSPKDIISDTIIDDIKYRLNMSPFEWQLWSLYASYVYKFHTDREIDNLLNRSKIEQGLSDIADHIISLPFDEQERICFNPMFFFDSMVLCSINSDSKLSVIYLKAQELFEEYNALSDKEKQYFIEKTTDFRDMSSDHAGYPVRCDYYDNYKEIPVYGNIQTQKEAIMQFLFALDSPIYTADEAEIYQKLAELVIDDVTYKLSMGQEQWDIWCLFNETVYNMAFCSSKTVSAPEILNTIISAIKKR